MKCRFSIWMVLLLTVIVALSSCAVGEAPAEQKQDSTGDKQSEHVQNVFDLSVEDNSDDVANEDFVLVTHTSYATFDLESAINRSEVIIRGTVERVIADDDSGEMVVVVDEQRNERVELPRRDTYYSVRVDETLYGDTGADRIIFKECEEAELAVGKTEALEHYKENRDFPHYLQDGCEVIFFLKQEQVSGEIAERIDATTVYVEADIFGTMGVTSGNQAEAALMSVSSDKLWSGDSTQEPSSLGQIKQMIAEKKN